MKTKQPRDSNGNFLSMKTVTSEDYTVTFHVSEFECRVIGNRLFRASERMSQIFDDVRVDQDCQYWAKRFLRNCSTRDERDEEYYENGRKRHTESNYHVKVEMTDYECWSLGNRLYEIGEYFDEQSEDGIAAETKWLARRFHAERDEAQE